MEKMIYHVLTFVKIMFIVFYCVLSCFNIICRYCFHCFLNTDVNKAKPKKFLFSSDKRHGSYKYLQVFVVNWELQNKVVIRNITKFRSRHQWFSIKKAFLKKISQENNCIEVSFYLKETPTEYCKTLK